MKKMMNYLKKGLTVMLTLLMILAVAPEKTEAEGPTLAEYEGAHETSEFKYFGFKKETLETADLTTTKHRPADKATPEEYEVRYPDSLDYFGHTVSVKVNVTFEGENTYGYNRGDTTSIWVSDSKEEIERMKYSVWLKAYGANFKVTVSLYEDNTFTTPFNDFVGAIAFVDPDQSNYLYNALDYDIYYQNKGSLGTKYRVEADGLKRISWGDIPNAEIGVKLYKQSSFTFTINGYADWVYLPDFIVVEVPYTVEYYYQNKDGTYPSEPNGGSVVRYQDILINPVATVTDEDKTSQRPAFNLDESKNELWSQEVKEDGSTVLKVYFKPSYTIKYDGNGGTLIEGKTMDDDHYYAENPTMPSKEEWQYERPGFEFIGYKLENEGELYTNSEDFRSILIEEEDREITLFAQWNPLDYKIKYDKNAEDATGEMADDDYTGLDETMPSKEEWTFERKGYKFIGFKVENDGEIFNGAKEFKPELLVDEDRVITLYAQWEALPYTIKYNANGGEGTMPDDVYKGSSEVMPSKEEWTFTREGYDFIGFKLENEGELLNGSKEYKDVLLDEEDREIELFAQWDPWKYTIKYDPNGGTGEMPDHIYTYEDPTMNSDENKYTRKGYNFIGFLYTDEKGNQTLYKNINDFRAELIRLGKNSEILLVAQWRMKPSKDTPYVIPVTGVE